MRLSNKSMGFTLAEGATHVAHCNNSCKLGFTLAEVLITLGIIGVVAAMTMPTLMNQTQGAQYKTAYKKALSALSQAVTLNVALDEWNFADADNSNYKIIDMLDQRMNVVRKACVDTTKCSEKSDAIKDAKDQTYQINVSTAGQGAGITQATGLDGANTTLFFNDGIMFSYNPTEATNCTKAEGATEKLCKGVIDVNGVKAPNRIVQCDNKTGSDCQIKNPTDIYPVVFYDSTVLPNSAPARAVLFSK